MMLKEFGLHQFFDDVMGKGDNPNITKADMILSCMDKFSVSAEDTVMVGDSKQDKDGADGAGVRFVGVAWGYGTIIDSVENVSRLKKQLIL